MSYRRPDRPGGLPSAPRSRPGGPQTTGDDPYTTQNSDVLSRRLRSQKSVATLSNPRIVSRAPLPASVRRGGSTSSSSSSSASLFDSERIERDEYSSSRSSIDVGVSDHKDKLTTDEQPVGESSNSHGLWNTMAAVTSLLTVGVSKALGNNDEMEPGEETRPGQESQLIRVMKAYHIGKARDPSELPDWLFEPHERGVGTRRRLRDEQRDPQIEESSQAPRPRGLQGVYQAAASNATTARANVPSRFAEDALAPTKATNRLKELRDAKRNALVTSQRDNGPGAGVNRSPPEVKRDRQAPPERIRVQGLPARGSRP